MSVLLLILFPLVIAPVNVHGVKIVEHIRCGWAGTSDYQNYHWFDITYDSSVRYYLCGKVAGADGTDSNGIVYMKKGDPPYSQVGSWSSSDLTKSHTGATKYNCGNYNDWQTYCWDVTSEVTGSDTYTVWWDYTSGAKALQIERTWMERQSGDITYRTASPTDVESGDTITVDYTAKNTGEVDWVDTIRIKADISVVEDYSDLSLSSGTSTSGELYLTIPQGTNPGSYSLGLWLYNVDRQVNFDRPDSDTGPEGVEGDSSTSTSEGGYKTVNVVGADNFESDNTYGDASTITSESQQTHSIHNSGSDVDWMKFTLSSTSNIVIETSGPSEYDTEMWLFDSGGVPNSDIAYDDDEGTGLYSKITYDNLPADNYFIKVVDYNENNLIPTYYIDFTNQGSNNPPSTPSTPTPSDGSTGRSVTTDLSWQGGDDPDSGDTVTYDVYFEANDATPDVLLCDDATSKSCDPASLSYDTLYYWQVIATDNHGASTNGPVWNFRTETQGGGGGNPDGDDLTDSQEDSLTKVKDPFGDWFPDPNKKDAYYPVHASEIYYRRRYYGKSFSVTDKETNELGAVGIFLAQLYKSTDNTTLKSDIQDKLEDILDELVSRQENRYFSYNPAKLLEPRYTYNMKGYINKYHGQMDYTIKNLNEVKEFLYDYNPSEQVGYAAMALLEGYDALGNTDYLNAGRSASDFLIGWHSSRGLDSNTKDDFYFDKLLGWTSKFGYHDDAEEEKNQRGGDKYLSTPNIYGTTLNAVSTMARINYSAKYETIYPYNTYQEAHNKKYSTIADWMVEEVRRLQRYTKEGGFRVGPLTKDQVIERLQEQIHYSGMTTFGTRQQYDNNENSVAYSIVTDLADHHLDLRDIGGGGAWWKYWNLDEKKPFGDPKVDQDEIWGTVIMISGFEMLGFRQGIVDMGGFLCSKSKMLNYILYEAMKMEEDPELVVQVDELAKPDCKPHWYRAGYSNPIIFQGGKKNITFYSDATAGMITAELKYTNAGSNLEFAIYNPSGTKINESNVDSFSNINLTKNATYRVFEVKNPEVGNWTLELEAITVPVSGELYYMQSIMGTHLYAIVETGSFVYAEGENIKLTTIVSNATDFVTGAEVTAEITHPTGERSTLRFYDGTHGDPTANDGYYTGFFSNTYNPGDYRVEVTASGIFNGNSYERKTTTSFEVLGLDKKTAYLTALVYYSNYQAGDTVSGFIYVENTGNIPIDDELIITIKGPTGERVYKEEKRVYLEPDESQFVRFSWTISQTAVSGTYRFKAEFYDVDGLPTVKSFEVG